MTPDRQPHMTAARTLQLTDAQRATLRRVLDATVPGARVAVFGSRATGRARPFSDVDLLILEPSPLPWVLRLALLDALEASDLPFRVDVVETATVPDAMRAHSGRGRTTLISSTSPKPKPRHQLLTSIFDAGGDSAPLKMAPCGQGATAAPHTRRDSNRWHTSCYRDRGGQDT